MSSHKGKCPKCAKPLKKVQVEDVEVYVGDEKRYGGVSFSCRKCNTVISCSLDPVVMHQQLVNDILQGLGKAPAGDIQLI